MKEIKSNLRWPGGKSKMTKILDKFFPNEVNKYLEVFTGGGSVLLYIIQKYYPQVIYANDIDCKLINYYNTVKNNPQSIIDECLEIKNQFNCETFKNEFSNLDRNKASHFFISNKSSFSGLNKNYSSQAFNRNFTIDGINKIEDISSVIQRVTFLNTDFVKLDDYIENIDGFFIYLDPPYKENNKIGLYGDKGELHKNFNHDMLFEWVQNHSKNNKIMISYDESSYIRNLYKNYNIYSFDFVYSMTNVGGKVCKKGGEIVITNYDIDMCPF